MSKNQREAFSLIEMVVVISILGIIISLLLYAVQGARHASDKISCQNNMRQLGIASYHYHDVNSGFPPSSELKELKFNGKPGKDKIMATLPWTVLLLPFHEQQALFDTVIPAWQQAFPWENPPHIGNNIVIPIYACPADGRLKKPITDQFGYTAAYGSYLAILSDDKNKTAFKQFVKLKDAEVRDGFSNTLYLGERPPPGIMRAGNWYANYLNNYEWFATHPFSFSLSLLIQNPGVGTGYCKPPFDFGPGRVDNPCDSHHFWSMHKGGGNFLFLDGSVRFIRYGSNEILTALATIAGGEVAQIND